MFPEGGIEVSAGIIIVDDDGTPGIDCNYTSIQDAIDNGNASDTIRVYDGTYYENVIVNKTVTLIGNGSMNTIINGSGIGDVVNVSVDFVNLTGFNITYSGSNEFDAGIELNNVSHCNIFNNSYSNNSFGIYLYNSSSNSITNNSIFNNDEGIYLSNSSSNNISFNSCSNNTEGIYLNSSSNNNITNNSFLNNQVGINLTLSSSNFIYHNRLIDNTNQSYDDTNNGNQWDNGYPSGGNYWSDYNGVDLNWTPTQDVLSPDGIGDTPYYIDLDSKDNYPLMSPINEIGPRIFLISPANNSVIQPGVILDFYVYDEDLYTVNYSIDGGLEQPFTTPFDVSTSGWVEGGHSFQINALDMEGNSNSLWYFFTIDSMKPIITLGSPLNNSIILSGTILDFSVIDLNLLGANYSVNGGSNISLTDPFNISTSGWLDGDYTVQINAQDEAGNSNSSWYFFTLDSASPIIILTTPGNNSIIQAGILLKWRS
jgi:parallel beta-helix repeat protein